MGLRTIGLISTLALGLLAGPLPTEAQQTGKVYRIGYLHPGLVAARGVDVFRKGLRDLGWIEGQNIAIEYRGAAHKWDRIPALAEELVRLKVDLIVVVSLRVARPVQRATKTIPIVVALAGDMVGTGLVASLARPGGNITGLTTLSPGLSAKRLELLKEAFPKVSRVAVLWNPDGPVPTLAFKETQAAARALGVQLQSLEVRSPDDFESAFQAVTRERADALLTITDPVTIRYYRPIAVLAAKSRLPAMYPWRRFVRAGGLMSYGVNPADLYRRAATYVDKILKGAKPGDLPIEQPTKFELVINLKTAKQLGITIPPNVLYQATKVIK